MAITDNKGCNVPGVDGRIDVTSTRFVVFMDIMGFKDRVSRDSHEEVGKMLSRLRESIYSAVKDYKDKGLQTSIFSDSVVLFSKDDSKESLSALTAVVIQIMRDAIANKVPMKGALAKGVITCDTTKQLFYGQALIDAYLLQESTKYYGVVVHHSAEKDVKQRKDEYVDVPAAMDNGYVSHYELDWHSSKGGEIMSQLDAIRETVSGAPRKYIDSTKEIIKSRKCICRDIKSNK